MTPGNRRVVDVGVYAGNGQLSAYGLHAFGKGCICFESPLGFNFSRGTSEDALDGFFKMICSHMREYPRVWGINFDILPQGGVIRTCYADGYWGRPAIVAGAILLKALPQRRQETVRRLLKSQKDIADPWGREIKVGVQK